MNPTLGVGLLLIALLGLCGMPLFAVIASVALLGFHVAGYDLIAVAVEYYRLGDMPGLIAIPLFTLAGYVLSESDAPKRLVRLSDALLGWLPGGLAIVALVTCAFFTAFTGASGMTIVAIGALLYPTLRSAGYPQRYSLGLVTSSGSLGLLFPPSLPLIVFGFVAGQLATTPPVTMEALFLAGLLPGLLMIAILALHAVWVGRGLPRSRTHLEPREVWAALKDARWELPLPFIVLGGIYSGHFAASEAAAVTALYVLVTAVLVRREIAFGKLPTIMAEAMRLVGAILIILGAAMAMSNWLVDQEVPGRLFDLARSHVHSAWAFLLLLNGLLLLVGMMMDIFSAIVVLTPLLLPVAVGYGIHPVHFGIVMLANLQIGYFMPPMGMDLVIAAYRFKSDVLTLARACLPFFVLVGLALLIITWWPGLSLALVK
ncbi:MAG: TRAP transporter large permease subunit [Chiayiivirga sp.]|uniref:TRAP transporter large permease n=1 Tax=Chiayiivirga sp. TaxID=2041042 RepID=UPI0025C456F7|nr:TRAP transporter large permease subunit [Chiayiivirga sp.]MCI1709752.1 TRAP transporter large permease subunit [Chiayiivirga sp.]MCI1729942.1 TRAP transporter large permease subunit [Chiayiivirga sp.]